MAGKRGPGRGGAAEDKGPDPDSVGPLSAEVVAAAIPRRAVWWMYPRSWFSQDLAG